MFFTLLNREIGKFTVLFLVGLTNLVNADYKCIAVGGSGNAGIARRIIHYINIHINNWPAKHLKILARYRIVDIIGGGRIQPFFYILTYS